MTLEYLRSFRIFSYAIFDLSISYLGVLLISPLLTKLFLKFGILVPVWSWLLLTLPIGILFHLLFGQQTQMTKDLFNPQGFYILKFLMISMIFLAVLFMKKVK
jgi:hypothetical protein